MNDYDSYQLSYTAEQIDELLKKLDSGVVLPVVEIADLTAFTAEECALLTKCIGSPIVVSASGAKVVCTYAFVDGSYIFTGYMMGGTIISVDGTNWLFTEE